MRGRPRQRTHTLVGGGTPFIRDASQLHHTHARTHSLDTCRNWQGPDHLLVGDDVLIATGRLQALHRAQWQLATQRAPHQPLFAQLRGELLAIEIAASRADAEDPLLRKGRPVLDIGAACRGACGQRWPVIIGRGGWRVV